MIRIKYLLDVGPHPIHKQGLFLETKEKWFFCYLFGGGGYQYVLMQTGLGNWHPSFFLQMSCI